MICNVFARGVFSLAMAWAASTGRRRMAIWQSGSARFLVNLIQHCAGIFRTSRFLIILQPIRYPRALPSRVAQSMYEVGEARSRGISRVFCILSEAPLNSWILCSNRFHLRGSSCLRMSNDPALAQDQPRNPRCIDILNGGRRTVSESYGAKSSVSYILRSTTIV